MNAEPKPDRGAALLFVASPTRVLLVKEANRFDAKWKLPGGSIKPGETPIDAAVREAGEEAGVVLAPSRVICLTDDRREEGIYRPFLCVALVTEEELDCHSPVGDEDGEEMDVGAFGREDIAEMRDLLEPHRAHIRFIEARCVTAFKRAG